DQLSAAGLDRRRIIRRGAAIYLKQIFEHGFFHADPHPGNIFVLPGDVICLFDFGMTGSVDRRTREDFVDLVDSVVQRDAGRTTRVLLELALWEDEPDKRRLERDVADFTGRHLYKPLGEIEIARVLHEMLELAARHRMRIPPDIFLMMKALSTIEGVARMLDPEFQMISFAAPFINQVKLARYAPQRMAGDLMQFADELLRFINQFPKDLAAITRQLKEQRLNLRVEHQGLPRILATQDQTSNRMAFAVVIAALIIGSALIVISETPPLFHGISLIGIIGFFAAAIMGIWLLLAILRGGRL
ncbi:MAG: AarF/UbiB family protein, partial [Desulfobacterales bacterium]